MHKIYYKQPKAPARPEVSLYVVNATINLPTSGLASRGIQREGATDMVCETRIKGPYEIGTLVLGGAYLRHGDCYAVAPKPKFRSSATIYSSAIYPRWGAPQKFKIK